MNRKKWITSLDGDVSFSKSMLSANQINKDEQKIENDDGDNNVVFSANQTIVLRVLKMKVRGLGRIIRN